MEIILGILTGLSTRPVTVVTEAGRLRQGEGSVMYGSINKLTSHTGWSPQIPLKQTLADVLDYWRRQLRAEAAGEAAGA